MKTYKERTQSILEKAEAIKAKRKKRIKTFSIIGSVAAAFIALNLVLFVPYTVGDVDISAYKNGEYYSVIQKLYSLSYSPRTTNNFTEWFGSLNDWLNGNRGGTSSGGDMMPGASASNEAGLGGNYVETTLNQTVNVIEGDLFKRSDSHIFYLGFTPAEYREEIDENAYGGVTVKKHADAAYVLRVYSVAAADSALVTEYKITVEENMLFDSYTAEREMFLSEDLTTVTIVSPCYDYKRRIMYTVAIGIDVSDLSDIKEMGRTYVSGNYVSSRTVDGNMILVSNFSVPRNVDFSDESKYLPQVGRRGEMQSLPIDNIVCPDDADSARYTVVCTLDKALTVIDSVALLSYSDDVYVSQNNLFTTREYIRRVKTKNEYQLSYGYNVSEIRIIPYSDGALGQTRAVEVDGSVLNRYCLDEYDGILRAATTVSFFSSSYTYMPNEGDPYAGVFRDRCLLYCIDLDTLETKAKIADFAPVGESVKSARFNGTIAYICTAEINYGVNGNMQITDPVFAFDLSDYENITYKDTGTIPGYSLSLIGFTDGTLLGIGFGKDRYTLKLELYEETDSNVTPLTAYESDYVEFSPMFKAHFVDKTNGLVGLGVRNIYNYPYSESYKLLRFDGYELKEILSVDMKSNSTDDMRATYIDGCIYIFGNDDFKVVEI